MSDAATHRFECPHNISTLCSRGNGKPTRERCAYCGGKLRVRTGRYAVVPWRRDGHYRTSDIVERSPIYEPACQVLANRLNAAQGMGPEGGYVVRWYDAPEEAT